MVYNDKQENVQIELGILEEMDSKLRVYKRLRHASAVRALQAGATYEQVAQVLNITRQTAWEQFHDRSEADRW